MRLERGPLHFDRVFVPQYEKRAQIHERALSAKSECPVESFRRLAGLLPEKRHVRLRHQRRRHRVPCRCRADRATTSPSAFHVPAGSGGRSACGLSRCRQLLQRRLQRPTDRLRDWRLHGQLSWSSCAPSDSGPYDLADWIVDRRVVSMMLI